MNGVNAPVSGSTYNSGSSGMAKEVITPSYKNALRSALKENGVVKTEAELDKLAKEWADQKIGGRRTLTKSDISNILKDGIADANYKAKQLLTNLFELATTKPANRRPPHANPEKIVPFKSSSIPKELGPGMGDISKTLKEAAEKSHPLDYYSGRELFRNIDPKFAKAAKTIAERAAGVIKVASELVETAKGSPLAKKLPLVGPALTAVGAAVTIANTRSLLTAAREMINDNNPLYESEPIISGDAEAKALKAVETHI